MSGDSRTLFETPSYRVGPLTAPDVDSRFVGWFTDSELAASANLPRITDRDQCLRWAAGIERSGNLILVIRSKAEERAVGFFLVFLDRANALARTAVILGERDHWGRGVVLECRSALLDFLFERLGVHKVWGRVNTRNLPSVFNYKAQGFAVEGVLRRYAPDPEGGRGDQYLFGLLRSEWRQGASGGDDRDRGGHR